MIEQPRCAKMPLRSRTPLKRKAPAPLLTLRRNGDRRAVVIMAAPV
jgi:hypothetical protein